MKVDNEKFKIIDIYGDEFIYDCEKSSDAIECFIVENGEDRLECLFEFLKGGKNKDGNRSYSR